MISSIVSLVCAVRHYEVVYLIHEKHAEGVGSVNEKVQGDFWTLDIFNAIIWLIV